MSMRSVVAVALVVAVSGCATNKQWGMGTTIGALGGAAVGAGTGVGIQYARDKDEGYQVGRGAAIGAAVGIVVGGLIGHFFFDEDIPPVAPPPPPEPLPEPEVAAVEEERRVTLEFGGVNFGFDQYRIPDNYFPELDKAAHDLLAGTTASVIIEGFTDDIGSEEYNDRLGLRRAESVRDYLVERGVAPERLSVVSFGESRPVATNDTPEGRAKNRRVELRIRTNGNGNGHGTPPGEGGAEAEPESE